MAGDPNSVALFEFLSTVLAAVAAAVMAKSMASAAPLMLLII